MTIFGECYATHVALAAVCNVTRRAFGQSVNRNTEIVKFISDGDE